MVPSVLQFRPAGSYCLNLKVYIEAPFLFPLTGQPYGRNCWQMTYNFSLSYPEQVTARREFLPEKKRRTCFHRTDNIPTE